MLAPFSPKAKAFFSTPPEQDTFFTLLEGQVRSGKTWAMMVKILVLNKYKVAGQKVLIGNSKETVRRNVLNDLFNFVGKKNYTYNSQTGQLSLYGVPWLVVGVSNEGSERAIRGMTAGVIVWDELTQAPQNVFEMALSRLSPEGSRFYATTNPDSPLHYLMVDWLANPEKQHLITRIAFTLDDNFSMSEAKRSEIRSLFKGVFYQRNILGLWVIAEGAIYRDVLTDEVWFDDTTRPVGLLGQGGHVARYIGVDVGTVNPTVFLDVYDDGQTLWQDREHYYDSRKEMRQKTDSEHADDLIAFIGNSLGAIVVVDPSAASFIAELHKRGIYTKKANNDVLDGIRHFSTMLGNRRYRIHAQNCPHTRDELSVYAWDEKAAARGEEKPIKEADHTADAARYVAKTMIPVWRTAA